MVFGTGSVLNQKEMNGASNTQMEPAKNKREIVVSTVEEINKVVGEINEGGCP